MAHDIASRRNYVCCCGFIRDYLYCNDDKLIEESEGKSSRHTEYLYGSNSNGKNIDHIGSRV